MSIVFNSIDNSREAENNDAKQTQWRGESCREAHLGLRVSGLTQGAAGMSRLVGRLSEKAARFNLANEDGETSPLDRG